jgi:PKD repeat protein
VINSPTKTGNCFSGLHPTAKMKATPSAGDSPLEVFLSGDQSTVPNGVSIVAYHWEIVGVGTITTQIPTTYYTFSEVGMHKVRLQVEASNGLKNTVSKQIVIAGGDNQPPTASFLASSTDVLVGETVTLDASASTDDYKIKKYIWSASNGSSIVSRDPI